MSVVRDFENAEASIGRVSAEMFASVLARTADMAMVLDGAGRVRDVAFGPSDLANAGLGQLIGGLLTDIVTSESRPKAEALVDGSSAAGRWRHVNIPIDGSDDLPLGLQAFGLGGGRRLVVGRDERQNAVIQRRFVEATRELDRAHARQRQVDLRLQTMLALSGLAMLTLDGETLAVIDASPAAVARLGRSPVGQGLATVFGPDEVAGVRDMLARATGSGQPVEHEARLANGEATRLQALMFRHERASRLLVRIDGDRPADSRADDLVAALPQGLVVTDARLRIELANDAFVDQVQLSLAENAIGQPLERFLGRGGVDTGILQAALREEPLVRGFVSVLTGTYGGTVEVEVDGVRLPDDRFGFAIRPAERVRRARTLDPRDRAGLAERMTEVVGRVALKEIVRDTTDVIERLCIETALELTDNNRAAAAEMLGISRQSLYAKLARYGVGNGPEEPGDQPA